MAWGRIKNALAGIQKERNIFLLSKEAFTSRGEAPREAGKGFCRDNGLERRGAATR